MKFPLMLSLYFAITTSTLAISLSKPGCQEKCGNVTIPYPFGIGSSCSANSSFTIKCQNSSTPFLSSINVEALNISLLGTVVVKNAMSVMKCSGVQTTQSLLAELRGSPFTISGRYNSLVVLGCENSVWLHANETTTVGGCTAMCDDNFTGSSCDGVNCCQTAIPLGLKEVNYTYKTTQFNKTRLCGYVFPVDKKWLRKNYKGLVRNMSNPLDDTEFGFAPMVLEWEFELKGYNGICKYSDDNCLLHPTSYRCLLLYDSGSYYFSSAYYRDRYSYYDDEYEYVSSTKYCSCPNGYEGNPYLHEGCSDVDECSNETLNYCSYHGATCINTPGYYRCVHLDHNGRSHVKIASISVGSGLGVLILLVVAWKSTDAIRKRIEANRKHKFFKRNGGLLLEQQMAATDNGLDKTMLFSSKVLTQATDHFNENRILGRGGQGTVYKGMLRDGRIVAVKKSKRIEEGDLQVFTNEVVILSQVNHRNVVKLLGCCLETEVPLLVYEFIPNGTLFQHIHEPNEEFPLTWEMRVRIAREVAGALAYLHSSASAPIYHRDIKSTNILLDDKYRAKVSDFGTSRSVALDQTHCTTRVLGTFGYLDPEYFQSNQFTEKSDVYSFGVVMVELLTGEKAISSIRAEAGRSLATHFLHTMEKNQLFDILDARVLKEGKRDVIMAVAHLARRCLHLNGKRRPTMKAVAAELEAIKEVEECSYVEQDGNGRRECHSIAVAESHDFSSISQSMHFDSVASFSPEAEFPLLGE